MSNSIDFAESLQDHSAAPLLCPEVLNTDDYTYCHWATTVVGLDPLSDAYVVIGVTCKRWGCPYCANRKVRRLAWMSRNAEPTRLLTLTQSTKDWQREDGAGVDGRRCWETTAPAFSELIRLIRKLVGECEYLKVLELTEQGLPHFHCMLRCDFVPQAVLLKEWRRLTGTAGVNIKRIDKSFATFRYLVKYLTKLHKIEWTDRHVSYSRNFFRPEDKEEVAYAKLEQVEHFEQHPWVWLRERSEWSRVRVLGEGKWELPGPVPDREFSFDPAEIGLPSSRPIAPPPAPLTQRLVPGMLDVDVPADDTVPTKRRRTKRATDASTVPF